jgi:hypothetical protein
MTEPRPSHTVRVFRTKRLHLVLGALMMVAGACTNSAPDDEEDSDSPSAEVEPPTTTEAPPIILALAPNLGLSPEQCFAEVPLVETTTTTTAPAEEPDDDAPTRTAQTPTTEATTPETLPGTSTIPGPATVAVVDCIGTNLGKVYATFCLGDDEDAPGQLTAVVCPGDPELSHPGDRNIRRSAARVCLQRFEEIFREEYATSARMAQEFTPTEGVWNLGDHRVVCHSQLPHIPELEVDE